ncbi:ribosomal protein L7/L12 [Flavobacterium hungaricum]|uniref:Uncharacterized protein n=1 Tax=Flavobacterium hungaricum TaxID=2082725 RepID=A0ABR9TP22_9FLAO|nr:ribosomal protein L7/L12 [Flavobacterium hungaricum]MBE8726769.1 hypothetical protein [Flavobacterium hungaricum]
MELEKYFQSFEDYFWEFDTRVSSDSGGEIISIPNTFTIAYEEFIFEILEFVSEDSFPPFGSLLLAIIGTNQENEHSIDMIKWIAEEKIKLNKASYSNPKGEFFRVGAVVDFLKILSSLPEEYKKGEKRLQLFQTIFHNCHKRVSSEKAKKILIEYQDNKKNGIKFRGKEPFNLGNFIKDFRTIAILKKKFPTVQELLRAIENVPKEEVKEQLPEEILEEKEAAENPLDFIEQLVLEEKTFQVGSLIKHIWSGLNIPFHHNLPSAQPLGGVSDLTNKGDFDKLLISEFAHDDDVFMSRIANNEALYIQREVPPEADKFQRILIIDTSLINWGNPKILAFASAIAVAAHPKTDIECKVFAVGDTYEEIFVESVEQVIDSLNSLSGKLSCAAGLDLFFKENVLNEKSQEIFFISSDESLKLQLMQKAMSDYFNQIKYVFATNVEGKISIFKNQNKGKKLLQEIVMPLTELWKKNKFTHFGVSNVTFDTSIPILYPAERNYKHIFHENDKYYIYLNGTLFLFSNNDFEKGFKKIASSLPFYLGEFAVKTNADGALLLLNYSYNSSVITIVNLKTKKTLSHKAFSDEEQHDKLHFFQHNQRFYFTNNVAFWKVKDSGEIELGDNPNVVQSYDEYFSKNYLFVKNFKSSKSKFTFIKRVDRVAIVKGEIQINNYYFRKLVFERDRKNFTVDEKRFKPLVNLVLKHAGVKKVAVIKLIMDNTGKSLKDVNEIVSQDLGIILENTALHPAENLKKLLENIGAVCYIETKLYESQDGSKISNRDGILIFESSDKKIPVFYIPFVSEQQTAMATEHEFAGRAYFINEENPQQEIDVDLFNEKYLNPFISNVLPWN